MLYKFFRFLYIGLIFLVFINCSSKSSDKDKAVHFYISNILVDSVSIRFLHYMDGRDLLDTTIAVGDTLSISNLKEDMYLLSISWNRTIIPHQIFKNKSFNAEEGDEYTLTKAIYIDPAYGSYYNFYLDDAYSIEDIEVYNIRDLKVDCFADSKCFLSDQYWTNYNTFFERKDSLVRQKSTEFYTSVDKNLETYSKNLYNEIDSIKTKLWSDSLYINDFEKLVYANKDNEVSTFFVFYQLYTDRDLNKYKDVYNALEGEATKSRYYRMLANQYQIN